MTVRPVSRTGSEKVHPVLPGSGHGYAAQPHLGDAPAYVVHLLGDGVDRVDLDLHAQMGADQTDERYLETAVGTVLVDDEGGKGPRRNSQHPAGNRGDLLLSGQYQGIGIGYVYPLGDQGLVDQSPVLGVAAEVLGVSLVRDHPGVLGRDVLHGDHHLFQELPHGRVVVEETRVRHRPDVVGRPADQARVVGASWNTGDGGLVEEGLLAGGKGGERGLQPHDVPAGNEFAHGPVGGPRVVQNRFPGPVASDGLGDQRGVVALYLLDGAGQTVRRQVVVDDAGTSPAGVTADEVCFPVAVAVEQGRQRRVGQVTEVGYPVFRGSRSVDEVTLKSPSIDLRTHGLHGSRLELSTVAGEPAVDPEIHRAGRHRAVELVVLHGDRTFHPVAQALQQELVHLRLEPPGVPRRPGHPDPWIVRCTGIRLPGPDPRSHNQEQDSHEDSQDSYRCSAHGFIRLWEAKVSETPTPSGRLVKKISGIPT